MGTLEVAIKRIKPNSLSRICIGCKAGVKVILGLSTFAAFILALFVPQHLNLKVVISIITLTILAGIITAFCRGKQKLIPDTFIDEVSSENNYSVSFCSQEDLREADEMTKPYFGSGFIPFDRIEQWRLKNEKGFVQINNTQGLLCACFVILGLERGFFDQFIAGKVTEHEIDSKNILSFEALAKVIK